MKRNTGHRASLARQQGFVLAFFRWKLLPGVVAGAIEFDLFYRHCRPLWPYIAAFAVGVVIWWLQRTTPRRSQPDEDLLEASGPVNGE
ncbi:hypothetical protein R70006_06234 [Paraburkholderia domus]|uniref:hypothetical protein n=1 Tax=Paraburkholderia domus TaxID=2793075 RepID=UPI001912BAC3|nr:hypothetical protein [Paraburkholderia domus]MBK5052865.1 hypothetical protein [Burkholderia sp. R-70006]CAE6821758.1 hypothetical protein R70006_06234 [Paraburkholderia domus]